ncbi:glutamine amidotransferase-related protein [Candidatus Symbiobacter mobilis]|uniref:GMP synthase-like protein n=1 Tax=Candidatus Symbiobacter mobilis CR TaxID=946483 RepID=U5N7T0_9BURK|nr:GMP synthase-like protein [Candidatus Symbiobacter mobilis]AGX87611.1 GMP synthase-like protein [Candidatus Symbiobacter mobilis CR]
MTLCILENDDLDPALAPIYGGYAPMFLRMLRDAGYRGAFEVFRPMRNDYPASFDAYDAVLLTGSRADAFADEPWIRTLRAKVDGLLATGKKLVGVCFGHQLVGCCMGARVGRAPQGWGVGRLVYRWLEPEMVGGRTELALLASHQDQVFDLPVGARLLATSDYCPIAAFSVGNAVLCVQPHPEFVVGYSAFLLDKQRDMLGPQRHAVCIQGLAQGHDGPVIARAIVDWIGADDAALVRALQVA